MNDLEWKALYAKHEAELERIQFALGDIAEVLRIWRDEKPITDPYMVEKWAEWDALIARKQLILKGQ